MTPTFLAGRIAATEALILAYEAAVDALVTGGVQHYRLDTAQTQQTVTKVDLPSLNKQLDVLYNRLSTLCARANIGGAGRTRVVPVW